MAQIDGRIHPSVARLWHRYYPHYDPDQFAALVASHVDPSSQVLEIGAGSGRGQQRRFALKGKVARYVGIDLDERVLDNPHLDEAVVGDAQHLPFEDGAFDVVFHTMVAEHLQKPLAAVAEMARVLRSGGRLIFQTPNRFYYPMLLFALTPHWFHAFYARKLGGGREASEVFATVYRLNDRRAIMSATEQAGLRADVQFWSTPPGYLRFSRPSFLLGVALRANRGKARARPARDDRHGRDQAVTPARVSVLVKRGLGSRSCCRAVGRWRGSEACA